METSASHIVSFLGKGIIVLHELKHAELHPAREAGSTDHDTFMLEEADVSIFEFQLLESLLGEPYIKVVEQYVSDVLVKYLPTDFSEAERILSKGLGAQSKELDFWLGVLGVHARWRFFKQQGVDARLALAETLKLIKSEDII